MIKKLSEETKRKISIAHKGKKLTKEHKQKLSFVHMGKVLSKETKAKISFALKGKKKLPFTKEHRKNISLANLGRPSSAKGTKRPTMSGKNNPNWNNGSSKNREYIRNQLKEWRHRLGISKRYNRLNTGSKYSKKQQNQAYKRRVRRGGKLPISRIQLVYEDNIKKYGTLTCYLCEKPILFGKDSLEHKTPLSRGGTNGYTNLAVACRSCNSKKYSKTEEEYRKENLIL